MSNPRQISDASPQESAAPPSIEPLRLEYATSVKVPKRQRVLMVLAIIALSMLAVQLIFVPIRTPRSVQSRISAAKADISAISMALEAFGIDTGSCPTTTQGLGALVAQPAAVENWHGPYVSRLPADPWGTPYIYAFPGIRNKDGFDLSSAGPDMTAGTKDDIQN